MRRHDACKIFSNRRFERKELYLIQASAIMRNERQGNMRISSCIAVTRKMFAKGENTVLLQSTRQKPPPKSATLSRIGAKGAGADDRVGGIVIDIQIGSEVNVNADSAHFSSHGRCHTISVLRVCRGANCHGRGKFGEALSSVRRATRPPS